MYKLLGYTVLDGLEYQKLTTPDPSIAICNADLTKCTTDNQALKTKVSTRDSVITNLQDQIEVKTQDIEALMSKIPKQDPLEQTLTNKYPKQFIPYLYGFTFNQPNARLRLDVRDFLQHSIDDQLPTMGGVTDDERATRCRAYVQSFLTYQPDKTLYGVNEEWQFAPLTMQLKKGDCECGAILMANMMIKAGIPYYKVRIACGTVKMSIQPDAEQLGHAYVCYYRDNGGWVVLDWCFDPINASTPINKLPLHKNNPLYMPTEDAVWFSFDAKNAYAQNNFYDKVDEKNTKRFIP